MHATARAIREGLARRVGRRWPWGCLSHPRPTGTRDQFRVVDCKYQYIQSIPDLGGSGQYDVEIVIDDDDVATGGNSEVSFDLK
jgi:hypothetical protein